MKRTFILNISILLFVWGCSEVQDWSDPTDSVSPGTITDAKVENLNGGARITYTLPDDKDLLGVKAVYSFNEDGEPREAFSSVFKDTIILEGYPDTNEHTVELITIDRSRNESQPVAVKIQPLAPPVDLILQTFRLNPTFGGLYTSWENKFEKEVAISLYTADPSGEWVLYETYYTSALNGQFAFRGLDNTKQQFRIEIRDRWENYSSPLDTMLTPLFEEEIVGRDQSGRDIWQRFGYDNRTSLYRGDITTQSTLATRQFRVIHDGHGFDNTYWWHTEGGNLLSQFIDWPDKNYGVFPIYFTIDMGKKASFSRLRYWMRSRSPYFSAQVFTSFEVWGTNEPKPLDEIGNGSKEDNLKYWTQWPEVGGTDQWKNDWIKLADCVLTLPSGKTDPNTLTDEDREFIAAGFEFEMDPQYSDQPFRYLRFVIRENREANTQIQLAELKFWGAYKE